MSWFKLYIPFVLDRKVLFEKHIKALDVLEKNVMSPIKKTILSYLSCLFIAAFIIYYVIVSFRLEPNMALWQIPERAVMLILSVVLSMVLHYFLTHQGDPEYTVLNISPFSYNWFVKLGSIFAVYVSLLVVVLIVYMFSCFTLDLTSISTLEMEIRGIFNAVLWVITFVVCLLSHNDIIPLYKIST